MNKIRSMTIRGMVLISVGTMLVLDLFGIVEKGVSLALLAVGLFIIAYGLKTLGFWTLLHLIFKRIYSMVFSFLGKFKRKMKQSKATRKQTPASSVKVRKKRIQAKPVVAVVEEKKVKRTYKKRTEPKRSMKKSK